MNLQATLSGMNSVLFVEVSERSCEKVGYAESAVTNRTTAVKLV